MHRWKGRVLSISNIYFKSLLHEYFPICVNIASYTTQHFNDHYSDFIMGAMASLFTSLAIVYSIVYLAGTDQRKHHSSALLAFVRGIHQWPVNSPHKKPVTRIMSLFDDVIMINGNRVLPNHYAQSCFFRALNWTLVVCDVHSQNV